MVIARFGGKKKVVDMKNDVRVRKNFMIQANFCQGDAAKEKELYPFVSSYNMRRAVYA